MHGVFSPELMTELATTCGECVQIADSLIDRLPPETDAQYAPGEELIKCLLLVDGYFQRVGTARSESCTCEYMFRAGRQLVILGDFVIATGDNATWLRDWVGDDGQLIEQAVGKAGKVLSAVLRREAEAAARR